MRAFVAVAAWLALAGPCLAELKIEGDQKVAPYRLVRLKAAGADPKAGLVWRVTPRKGVDRASAPDGALEFVAPPGVYTVDLLAVRLDAGGKTQVEEAAVEVAVGQPEPGPGPGPDPGPGPTPVDPPPIPGDGFRVLILYEKADEARLPAPQRDVFYSPKVRSYLKAKCAADPDADDKKAYRIWDQDTATDGVAQVWKESVAKTKAHPGYKAPWIAVTNGKTGYSGPLPATPDSTLELLRRYGGAERGKK